MKVEEDGEEMGLGAALAAQTPHGERSSCQRKFGARPCLWRFDKNDKFVIAAPGAFSYQQLCGLPFLNLIIRSHSPLSLSLAPDLE